MPQMILAKIGEYLLIALAIVLGTAYFVHKHDETAFEAEKLQAVAAEHDLYVAKADQANQLATELETEKARSHDVYHTIETQIPKFIDRPVYTNVCIDDDGLLNINAALSGRLPAGARVPSAAVPSASTPSR